jgi:6-phosphogluconolactonase
MHNKNIHSFTSVDLLNFALYEYFQKHTNITNPNIILSGGNSPKSFYHLLAKHHIEWSKFKITLSDERDVDVNNKKSNEGSIKKLITNDQFNKAFVGLRHKNSINILNEINEYHFCLLGMGLDGHFASIFPTMNNLHSAYNESVSLINVKNGFPDVPRISMTLTEINKANNIVLLIHGKEKMDLLLKARPKNKLLPIDKLFLSSSDKIHIFSVI